MTSKEPTPRPERNTAASKGTEALQWAGQARPNQPDCDPTQIPSQPPKATVASKLLEQRSNESELHVRYTFVYMYISINVSMYSSQEPPFRKSFANLSPAFAVPYRLHCPKSRIRIRNQIYVESNKFGYKLFNKSVVVYPNECGSNQNVIVIYVASFPLEQWHSGDLCHALAVSAHDTSLAPISGKNAQGTSGMAKCSPFWAGHGSSGYVCRASFARLSRTLFP